MYLTASRSPAVLSNKYDITKHKRYKELADFNKNNAFDVEKISGTPTGAVGRYRI